MVQNLQNLRRGEYKLGIEVIPKYWSAFFGSNRIFGYRPIKTIYFVFKEATIQEMLDLEAFIKKGVDNEVFLYEFLNEYGKISVAEYSSLPFEKRMELIRYIINAYTGGYYTFNGKEEDNEKQEQIECPVSSTITIACKEANLSPEEVLRLTWKQFNFILEGVNWNINAQTKEGQARNQKYLNRSEVSDDEALAEIQRMEKSKNDKQE